MYSVKCYSSQLIVTVVLVDMKAIVKKRCQPSSFVEGPRRFLKSFSFLVAVSLLFLISLFPFNLLDTFAGMVLYFFLDNR
jgi:hypothetical protein